MTHAEFEFDLLEKKVEKAIISPFRKEILALVSKVLKSGQSGGSMPYTASAVSQAVESLCMQENIFPITGEDWEWNDISKEMGDNEFYQNNRLSSIFKKKKDGKAYFLDAIIFEGEGEGNTFSSNGSVKTKDGKVVTSRQYIKEFPFIPKSFYIDVIDYRYDRNKETGELIPNPEGDWWEHVIKDESQLNEVFDYYDEFEYIEPEEPKNQKPIDDIPTTNAG